MAVLHITEAELARDLHRVLEKVRLGTEVIVEHDNQPVAVLRPPTIAPRTISESLALLSDREAATLDPEFAADVEEVVRNRRPWAPTDWD